MLRCGTVIVCVAALVCSWAAVASATSYSFYDLGSAGDGTASGLGSIAYGINNENEVVGRVIGASSSSATLWTLDTVGQTSSRYTIPPLKSGGTAGWADGINDSGVVVGQSTGSSSNRAFVWTPTVSNGTVGTAIDLGAKLPGVTAASRALAINNSGRVVAYGLVSGTQTGFYWDGVSSSATLIAAPSGTSNAGFSPPGQGDINTSGLVVGYNALSSGGDVGVTWTSASPTATSINDAIKAALAPPGEGCSTLANGVNDTNEIVGYALIDIDTDGVPFLYQDSSHVYNLGLAEPAAMNGKGHALAINSTGTVIGYGEMQVGGADHAFVWTPSTPNGSTGTMVDLNSVVTLPSALSSAGYYFQQAYGIDNNGDIVGELYNGTSYRAFALVAPTTTPEPSTLLLAASGLAGLLAYAWRKRK